MDDSGFGRTVGARFDTCTSVHAATHRDASCQQEGSLNHTWNQRSWGRKAICGFILIARLLATAALAETITGVARNQTRGKMAAGDEVILLSLDHDKRELARTRTDSHGSFAFDIRGSAKQYLIRAVHEGVNYDAQVSAGHVISIDVFDVASNVKSVTGIIEIVRAGTKGNQLHVSDMIEVNNESRPPMTQAGQRTFEVYLPVQAKIDSVLAAGSEKIGALISPAPMPGQPGHYTVSFPLRPGATKFAFNYDMPYNGHAAFHPKHSYALQQLAVMLPPTMQFSSGSPAFQVLPTGGSSYRVEAASRVEAGDGPEFEISGVGPLPALHAQAQTQPPRKPPAAALPTPALATPRSSGANALDANSSGSATSASSSPPKWWLLGASVVLVPGTCVFLLLRRRFLFTNAITASRQKTKLPKPTSASFVGALKGELFQLEIDRLHGTISGEDYDSAKQALERTVGRALARSGAGRVAIQD